MDVSPAPSTFKFKDTDDCKGNRTTSIHGLLAYKFDWTTSIQLAYGLRLNCVFSMSDDATLRQLKSPYTKPPSSSKSRKARSIDNSQVQHNCSPKDSDGPLERHISHRLSSDVSSLVLFHYTCHIFAPKIHLTAPLSCHDI